MIVLKLIWKLFVVILLGFIFFSIPTAIGFAIWTGGKGGEIIWFGLFSPLASALGFAVGIKIFERKLIDTRGGFFAICRWTFSGVIIGYAIGRTMSPCIVTCINYMFAGGIVSAVIREIVMIRRNA